MISTLRGQLAATNTDAVVIDILGIGFTVLCPTSMSLQLANRIGEEIQLYTSLQLSTDDVRLFGFLSERERRLFELLISVERVGPKVALAALSSMSDAMLIRAIATGNIPSLSAIPGLGRKTVERLILELREKIAPFQTAEETVHESDLASVGSGIEESAILALTSLGYAERESRLAVDAAMDPMEPMTLQTLISRSLRELGPVGAGRHD